MVRWIHSHQSIYSFWVVAVWREYGSNVKPQEESNECRKVPHAVLSLMYRIVEIHETATIDRNRLSIVALVVIADAAQCYPT
jgi:hypothetical protein